MELSRRLDRFPSAGLAMLPTPLDRCARLAARIGLEHLWVKREDLCGSAFGGNKSRHLDLIFGRAGQDAPDAVVTMGALQSNQCRQVAAAAARTGLSSHVILR